MDELTAEQTAELRDVLVALRGELERLLDATREGTRPVDLDEPIGRLTRMDAMQQQSMSAANRGEHDLRLRLVQQALRAMEQETYGLCRKCEEPVGYARLKARPESPFCIDCQDAIERKRG
jgi:DnaK suppressor protein